MMRRKLHGHEKKIEKLQKQISKDEESLVYQHDEEVLLRKEMHEWEYEVNHFNMDGNW